MKTPREKYMFDNKYKTLVDTMCSYIQSCHCTPSEMREAAILACIHYEERNIQLIIAPQIPKAVENALKEIHEWTTSEDGEY